MSNDRVETTEKVEESPQKSSEHVGHDVDAGMEDLSAKARQYSDYLRAGGSSGITHEFGKPLILDDAVASHGRTGGHPLDGGTIDGGVPPADTSRPPMDGGTPPTDTSTRPPMDGGTPPTDTTSQPPMDGGTPPRDATAPPTDGQTQPSDSTVHPQAPAGFHLPGEVINRDVEPGRHQWHRGERVEDIAREHLGPGATDEQVAAYTREINHANRLDRGRHLRDGMSLNLPGHTADGGVLRTDDHGNRQTVWADGTVREQHSDGSGVVRRTMSDGSTTEHHWGTRPSDNYELQRTADGHYRVADAGEQPHDVADPSSDVRIQRARVEAAFDRDLQGTGDDTTRAREAMRQFEERARRDGLSDQEVAHTYEQVARMMEHHGDQPTTDVDRRMIAEQVLTQAANPQGIDQGNHETCAAAALESRMYTRSPSDAARLVADVSTTGQYTTHDTPPRTITVPPGSLRPGDEEMINPPIDGQRSHASQIFQVTAINIALDARSGGQQSYEQHPPRPQTAGQPPDTGERVIDRSTTPPTTTPFTGLQTGDIQVAGEAITGRHEQPYVIEYDRNSATNTAHFHTEQEMNDRLREARDQGRMPVVLWVDSSNEPFRTDSGGGVAGGSGRGHFVTITDYDPGPPARAAVDNQWGDSVDHRSGDSRVSVHDLYQASIERNTTDRREALRRDVEWDRAHHTEDGFKELEYLRLQRLDAGMSQADFDSGLVHAMRDSRERWATRGETYPGERQRTEQRYQEYLQTIRAQSASRAAAIETQVNAH